MTVPPGPGVRVGRDVLGQLVVGSYNVVVNATQGSSVTVRAGGPPSTQRRPYVRSTRLRPGLEPLGRERELAQLTWWLDQGVPVQVCGDSGIGKTTLLRHLVSRRTRTTEVLYLSAAGLAVDDVLQDVFEACYESDGYKPEARELRRLMTSVQVLFVLDDFEGSVDDVGVLLDVLPACDLLYARADRCLWGGGETLPLGGLPQQAGLALLGRLLGRPLRPDELPKAIQLWERAGGRPLALLQSAATFTAAESGRTLPGQSWEVAGAALAQTVAAQLSASAHDTLRVLHALDGLPVPVWLLPQLTGRSVMTALTELAHAGLVEQAEQEARLAGPLARQVAALSGRPLTAAALTPALSAWAGAARPGEVADAAPALARVLEAAVREGDPAGACRLARTAAPRLAMSLHWAAWARVLALGRQAASQANAHADQAYFDHEDQVRRRCLGLATATGAAVGTAFAVGKHMGASQAASPPAAAPAIKSAPVRNAGRVVSRTRGKSGFHMIGAHPVIAGLAAAGLAAVGVGTALGATSFSPKPSASVSSPVSSGPSVSVSSPVSSGPSVSVSSPVSSGPSVSVSSPASSGPSVSASSPAGGGPSVSAGPMGCVPNRQPLNFEAVTVGSTKSLERDFYSDTCHPNGLDTKDMSIQGSGAGAFSIDRTGCPDVTTPENICKINVIFAPTMPGEFKAVIFIPEAGAGLAGGHGEILLLGQGTATTTEPSPSPSITEPSPSPSITEPSPSPSSPPSDSSSGVP
jgi:hypothetical protein